MGKRVIWLRSDKLIGQSSDLGQDLSNDPLGNSITPITRSMLKMSVAGEDHGHPGGIGSGNHFLVAN